MCSRRSRTRWTTSAPERRTSLDAVSALATVEGLRFTYTLYELPPGRLPLRRWRWELWHGARLVAAGWRFSRPDAGRALRRHAAATGHALFGLPAPPRDAPSTRGDLRPGATERIAVGAVTCVLAPRGLEAPAGTPAGV